MSTIAAISTALGNGGIGIIRMSGKDCFKILQKIFITKKENKLNIEEVKGYTIKYGYIIDVTTGEKIDEVLVSFFKSPKSYTTENMCEISSHGGMVVEKRILEQCLKNGAKLSEPGEFTKRAFLNGRIDLCKAESIIDIINSKTTRESRASMNQLQGVLSEKITDIRQDLLDIIADIEASIDYPEYDIEEVTNEKTKDTLNEIKGKLIKLQNSFNTGKIIKEGINTAIIGRPNVGKSSLLNNILKEERAIVSDIEGTTRDTIEEYVTINGLLLKIIDTAGIRKTTDEIEKIGVKKAVEVAKDAELILAVFDNTKELNNEDYEILDIIKDKNAIILLNKIDIIDNKYEEKEEFNKLNKKIIKMSAKNGNGVDNIYKEIERIFSLSEIKSDSETIITNIRHKQQIDLSIINIEEAIKSIEFNLPLDIISIYIKKVLEALGEITGQNVSEDIINKIFSKFCLGK